MNQHWGFKYSDTLCHHGIAGQKWGKRRYQNPDGSLTPEGRIRYGYTNHAERVKGKRKVVDIRRIKDIQTWDDNARKETVGSQLKKAITFNRKPKEIHSEFHDTGRMPDNAEAQWVNGSIKGAFGIAKANKKYAKTMKQRQNEVIDKNTGFYKKEKKLTSDEDVKLVNPCHTDISASSSNNCCLCSVAYDVRRRGYDVMSKQHAKIDLLWDVGENDVKDWYPGAKLKRVDKGSNPKQMANNAINSMLKEPDNTRGCFFVSWGEDCGGHVVAYERQAGQLTIRDAQCGESYKNIKTYKDLPKIYSDTSDMRYMRLDNVSPDWNKIREAIE